MQDGQTTFEIIQPIYIRYFTQEMMNLYQMFQLYREMKYINKIKLRKND